MVFNTPSGKATRHDDAYIRSTSISQSLPCITTLAGIRAVVSALSALHSGELTVRSLQEINGVSRPPAEAREGADSVKG